MEIIALKLVLESNINVGPWALTQNWVKCTYECPKSGSTPAATIATFTIAPELGSSFPVESAC